MPAKRFRYVIRKIPHTRTLVERRISATARLRPYGGKPGDIDARRSMLDLRVEQALDQRHEGSRFIVADREARPRETQFIHQAVRKRPRVSNADSLRRNEPVHRILRR